MYSVYGDLHNEGRVSPFGNLRVSGCLLLTEDYRRLTASFIGSVYQGILHGLLVFFPVRGYFSHRVLSGCAHPLLTFFYSVYMTGVDENTWDACLDLAIEGKSPALLFVLRSMSLTFLLLIVLYHMGCQGSSTACAAFLTGSACWLGLLSKQDENNWSGNVSEVFQVSLDNFQPPFGSVVGRSATCLWWGRDLPKRLLRKEVIQAHVLVHLPCYDFTLLTDHTFGTPLLAVRVSDFGYNQLGWCDGRCVQGPGTYSTQYG